MRKQLILAVLACLSITALASAGINFQRWNTNAGNNAAILAFLVDPLDPVPTPDEESVLDTAFYANLAENYVARLYGWITVPTTGNYTFYIHSDDSSMLYISTDGEISNAVEVARVDGWVNQFVWQQMPTQTSAVFALQAGQIVAVNSVHQEGTAGDHLGIGWTGPGISTITLIDEWVSEIAPTPTKARNIGPGVDATDVPVYSTLNWTAGQYAATHDVYLSMNFDDVNDRSALARVSQGQTGASFDPDLVLGETYYWAVDEVNAAPDFTVYPGVVWSFTVEPVTVPVVGVTATASSEFAIMPASAAVDGSGLVDGLHDEVSQNMWLTSQTSTLPAWIEFDLGGSYTLASMSVWNQNQLLEVGIFNYGAKDVVVETSTDGSNWTVVEGATEFAQAPGLPGSPANTIVDMGGVTASHVRVTINSNYGFFMQTGLAEVQFNAIPVAAREPQPADRSTTESLDVMLAWRGGRSATSHQVLFSDNEADVSNGTAMIATTAENERRYDLSSQGLLYGGSYYWAIDEIADDGSVAPGPVWTFQATRSGSIDDMEIYGDEENLEIWNTWMDGYGDEAHNGGLVGTGPGDTEGDRTNFSEGTQSLPLRFNNTGAAVSYVTREFSPALDFTRGAPDSLALDVLGDGDPNDMDSMYVTVADSTGKSVTIGHTNPAITQSILWNLWAIPMTDLAGINLKAIASITIGVGRPNGVPSGAAGTVYVDNLRVGTLP